jgi:serine/threonine-protein kinase
VQKIDERTGGFDIWMIDTARGVPTRLTIDASDSVFPVFAPDGDRVLFASNRNGALDLYTISSSGVGAESLVLKDDNIKFPFDWTRDGKFIIYAAISMKSRGAGLYALKVDGAARPIELMTSKFDLGTPKVSPDSRYLAYSSEESGRTELYVREFKPDDPASARRWQVSSNGGRDASWDPAGKELYYVDLSGMLIAVDTAGLAAPVKLRAQPLFRIPIIGGAGDLETISTTGYYAVLNSRKFLVVKSSWTEDKSPLHVLVNWTAALRK